jgi:hypothetical protein
MTWQLCLRLLLDRRKLLIYNHFLPISGVSGKLRVTVGRQSSNKQPQEAERSIVFLPGSGNATASSDFATILLPTLAQLALLEVTYWPLYTVDWRR